MGVRGFQSFVDNNPELSEEYALHDTQLVLDGNNLAHYLYLNSKGLDRHYGGNYDKFQELITSYFHSLQSCNVSPVLVFDGGYDRSGSKLPLVKKRYKGLLEQGKDFSKLKSKQDKIPPVLMLEVFQTVARLLNCPMVQCAYEADNELVSLANHLKCPLSSQDSDFYIYDLPHGFVRLDSIGAQKCEGQNADGSKYFFLKAKIYHAQNLLNFFPKLDRTLLPLFGTLIGNDLTQIDMFESFFGHIHLPKNRSKRLQYNKRHVKMIGLLEWLEGKSFDTALTKVMSFLTKDKRDRTQSLIVRSVENYHSVTTNIHQHLEESNIFESELRTNNETQLPEWFTRAFHQVTLPDVFCNVLGLRQIFLKPQIEDFTQTSCYSPSLQLRKLVYSILLEYNSQNKDTSVSVVEWERKGSNLAQNTLNIEIDPKLPTLVTIPDLSITERQTHLLTALEIDVSSLESVPENMKLFVATLVFFTRNTKVIPSFIDSLLLCYLYLTLLKPTLQSKTHNPPDICSNILPEEVSLISETVSKIIQVSKDNKFSRIDVLLLHCYGQFQACIAWMIYLNRLLLNPFEEMNPHVFLNGTLLCTLAKSFHGHKHIIVSKFLKQDSYSYNLYSQLKLCLPTPQTILFKGSSKPKAKHKSNKNSTKCLKEEEVHMETDSADVWI